MTKFKFFRGYVGTLNVMDGQTYATASFNDDTPEGYMGRRRQYHTREMYQRPIEDGVITQQQWNLNRDTAAEQGERLHRDLNDNPIRLFQTTMVTINPKWWMKIKMGLQEMSIFFKSSPYGIMFIWASSTIGVILILSKILNVW
jgi:hypothetical protein